MRISITPWNTMQTRSMRWMNSSASWWKMLENRDEKTILVMYGDHLPALQMDEDTH